MLFIFMLSYRMHERETATEKEFDIISEMSLDCVLGQRFEQTTKWTAKVLTLASTYKCFKTRQLP